MFTIRSASSAQASILTEIHRESFSNYWNVDAFNDFFAIVGTQALIAYNEDEFAVGILVYRVQHDHADIMTIAVRPSYRRQHIGRALLNKAMEEVATLGAKELFLDVEDGNEAALVLYKAYDFKQISKRKHYYRQKDGSYTDALVLSFRFSGKR